jgi:hypothetical protein
MSLMLIVYFTFSQNFPQGSRSVCDIVNLDSY